MEPRNTRANNRLEGKIIKLVNHKGYGFIEDQEGVVRFFHANEVDDYNNKFEDLEIGTWVSFYPYRNNEGKARASRVRVATGHVRKSPRRRVVGHDSRDYEE